MGTVTFLFTDIEGSTRMLRELGDGYGEVLDEHRRILREHLTHAGGREIDTQGDAFFFSFTRARDAVGGAVAAQRALTQHDWRDGAAVRVRMGLHTGEPAVGDGGYHGLDVVRAARICSAGHGGQILMSETTKALIGNDVPDGVEIVDVGLQPLKDLDDERLFRLTLDEAPDRRAPKIDRRPHKSRADVLAEDFDRRIEGFVGRQLERSLANVPGAPPPVPKQSSAATILAVIFGGAIALVLVVKLAFF